MVLSWAIMGQVHDGGQQSRKGYFGEAIMH